MNTQEFSDTFDTLLYGILKKSHFAGESGIVDISFDEYEKSVFLTKAQEELVIELYNGKNPYRESFESTEEIREYLKSLITTAILEKENNTNRIKISDTSVYYTLPNNIAFIIMEQVTLDDNSLGCYNGTRVKVQPITHDEYEQLKKNPFRGVTKNRVLKLDHGDNTVEVISKYKFTNYIIKYLQAPYPIILIDLPDDLSIRGFKDKKECILNPLLHEKIVERAVNIALKSKGIGT